MLKQVTVASVTGHLSWMGQYMVRGIARSVTGNWTAMVMQVTDARITCTYNFKVGKNTARLEVID